MVTNFWSESAKMAYRTFIRCTGIPQFHNGLNDHNAYGPVNIGDDPSTCKIVSFGAVITHVMMLDCVMGRESAKKN